MISFNQRNVHCLIISCFGNLSSSVHRCDWDSFRFFEILWKCLRSVWKLKNSRGFWKKKFRMWFSIGILHIQRLLINHRLLEHLLWISGRFLELSALYNSKNLPRLFVAMPASAFLELWLIGCLCKLCKLDNASNDVCQQPRMDGNGTDSIQRWYYDLEDQLCRAFLYTG